MKRFLAVVLSLIFVLSLAACGKEGQAPASGPSASQGSGQVISDEGGPSPASGSVPEPSAPASEPISGPESPSGPRDVLDLLRAELWERGIEDCRDMEAVPYDHDINGCMSYEEEIPAEELVIFQFFEDRLSAPGKYIIAAVTKDGEKFFDMSMVDGVLYDIRESPYYLHEGEYRIEEAQRELEEFLTAETDIDPAQYRIQRAAKWGEEGAARYVFTLFKKEAENEGWHDFEFYLSKDLGQIIRVDYEEGPVEQYRYMETLELTPGDETKERYTMEEAQALLERWLEKMRPGERIVKQGEVQKFKNTFYRFWTLLEDGGSNMYEISWDLFYRQRFEVIETTGKVPRYTELRD